MEISAINSLAEVGVGVNLAFSLIKGIRDHFGGLFKKRLDRVVETAQITLAEIPFSNFSPSQIAVDVSDIEQKFDKREDATTRLLAALAVAAAIVDIWILYRSAMDQHMEVSSWNAGLAVALAVGPILLSLLINLAIYKWTIFWLDRELDKYDTFAKVAMQMKVKITPAEPTE